MAQIEVRESEIKIMYSKILLYEKIEKIETLFKQRGEEKEKGIYCNRQVHIKRGNWNRAGQKCSFP